MLKVNFLHLSLSSANFLQVLFTIYCLNALLDCHRDIPGLLELKQRQEMFTGEIIIDVSDVMYCYKKS